VVGVVDSVVRSDPSQLTVTLVDRQTVSIGTKEAFELFGSGPGDGRLLLYGSTDGRVWYGSVSALETSQTSGCFGIGGPAVFDEPDAVVSYSTNFATSASVFRRRKDSWRPVTPSGHLAAMPRVRSGSITVRSA
jgi:hypothetical protein